jgi:ATP-dependent RNA helicase RhlE
VATDIAARGIDVDELRHVINYEIPNIPETYVHRIGRTGRAGADGTALSFCDAIEKEYLRDIEKLIGKRIPVVEYYEPPEPKKQNQRNSGKKHSSGKSNGRRSRSSSRRKKRPRS